MLDSVLVCFYNLDLIKKIKKFATTILFFCRFHHILSMIFVIVGQKQQKSATEEYFKLLIQNRI